MKDVENGDIVVYNCQYIAKVLKAHEGYGLLTIRIYHKHMEYTDTTISSTLCQKFDE